MLVGPVMLLLLLLLKLVMLVLGHLLLLVYCLMLLLLGVAGWWGWGVCSLHLYPLLCQSGPVHCNSQTKDIINISIQQSTDFPVEFHEIDSSTEIE
jgi:hypothetical protein